MTTRHWQGSTQESDKTGKASFVVNGEEFSMRLDSFAEFQRICQALDESFALGRSAARKELRRALNTLLPAD